MVSRRTNFGERSEPALDGGSKLQSAGGRHKVTFRHCEPVGSRAVDSSVAKVVQDSDVVSIISV